MSKVKIFLSKPLVVNMGKDQDGQQINDGAAAGNPLPARLPGVLLRLFLDHAPEAQQIFRRENHDGDVFKDIKKQAMCFVDVIDRFQ